MISAAESPLPLAGARRGREEARGRRRDDDRQEKQRSQRHDTCRRHRSRMSVCVLLVLVLVILLPSPTEAGLLKVRTLTSIIHTLAQTPSYTNTPSSLHISYVFPRPLIFHVLAQHSFFSSLPPTLPSPLSGRPPPPLARVLTPPPSRPTGRRTSIPQHLPPPEGHQAGWALVGGGGGVRHLQGKEGGRERGREGGRAQQERLITHPIFDFDLNARWTEARGRYGCPSVGRK